MDFATTNITATNGIRYAGTNGTLTFGDGVTNLTVTVNIINDSIVEGDQTFGFILSNPRSTGTNTVYIVGGKELVITIQEDDAGVIWL